MTWSFPTLTEIVAQWEGARSAAQPGGAAYRRRYRRHQMSSPAAPVPVTGADSASAADLASALAVSATKSMTGHMMGAAGAFEGFATVMSIVEQCVPPTINYRNPDPDCDLWILTEATPLNVRYALSNNIGLGGHNGAVIFKHYAGD